MRFDQSIEVFVPVGYGEGRPSGMYRGSSKVPAIRVCLSHESAFPAPYDAPSSGAGEDREVDVCVCGVLPRLHLPKKEGEKRGRRIEGRELVKYLV